MEDMIRRMCRAYWAVVRDSNHTDGSYTDQDLKGMQAAIEELREPTKAMVNAMGHHLPKHSVAQWPEIRQAFTAAIDAAKEPS